MITPTGERPTAFEHEALIFRGDDELLAGTMAFLQAGIDAGDPMLVALPPAHLRAVRAALDDSANITFVDVSAVGRNPARLIALWDDFVVAARDRGTPRGVGEPVWPGRGPDEVAECGRHEALLNVAFADAPPWRLLCPYDARRLPTHVVEDAERTHPVVSAGGVRAPSPRWAGPEPSALLEPAPLTPVPPSAMCREFRAADLPALRRLVLERSTTAGLPMERATDLALAAHEVAVNSVRHGGGAGTLHLWQVGTAVVVDVRDAGKVPDLLVGRRRPSPQHVGGRGLWMANQLCDLVQVRPLPGGTAVRLHQRRA